MTITDDTRVGATAPGLEADRWVRICPVDVLRVGRGVAALLGEAQVALFLLVDGSIVAVGNHDPFSGANVISRGIVGSTKGQPMVASPVYKQRFSLTTGACLDDEDVRLPRYDVRTADGWIDVAAP